LILRFINYDVPQEYEPTIEERYNTNLQIEGKDYEVTILDTSGDDEYPNMMDLWIFFGEGFLLVFSIDDKESFELLKDKHAQVLKGKHGAKCPILLVGNKQDLESERKVQYSAAKSLADSWGIEYIETSSKTNFNCKKAFEKLAQAIVKSKSDKSSGGFSVPFVDFFKNIGKKFKKSEKPKKIVKEDKKAQNEIIEKDNDKNNEIPNELVKFLKIFPCVLKMGDYNNIESYNSCLNEISKN